VPRVLNTIEGESWFVTLSGTGTTGIGGTNTDFTLEPGTYEISFSAPVLISDNCISGLYDITNSAFVKYSAQDYSAAAYWSGVQNLGNAVITIGASTKYRIDTQVGTSKADYGLGYQAQPSTVVATYTQVKIRKLK
jgi:hypothetical protein